jgi:sigma-B regulation protein RsbU (phosphoserine phosphatase)
MARDSETRSEDLIRLKDRALSATAEGITIADARRPDHPLIYVNAGFERLTGYSREDVVGQNCRFLQGAGTDANTVAEIRDALAAARECTVEILNYRKDGTPFWNRLSITPVRDHEGEVTHFIGVQSDVSVRRRAEDELRRAKGELETALGELRRDLDLAARVQRSLLPSRTLRLEGVEVAWEFRPCSHLAGDFLNVFALDDRHVAFYVLDVSGHGASAALLSVTLSRWLSPTTPESCLFIPVDDETTTRRVATPGGVARWLNQRFQLDAKLVQYFTLVYAVLEVPTGRLDYVAAGHPGPLHVPVTGNAVVHPSTAKPIGLFPDVDFEQASLELAPGDRFYLYTDGLTDAVNREDEELGERRLSDTLEACRDRRLADSIGRVLENLEAWQGGEASTDDVSLLAARIG